MKPQILTTLLAASATLTGLVSNVKPAAAFDWNNSWNQSTIYNKSQTNFNDLPFQRFVQAENVSIPNAGQFLLDPTKLKLKYDHDVSVYFINEGSLFRNQLAYEATGTTNQSGLVFNDISSAESIGNWGGDALDLGDGVKLGKFTAGTQLDFFLRADGFNRGSNANLYGTKTTNNSDGLQHVVAYAYKNYVLMGFEDLYGEKNATGIDPKTGKWNEKSDRDYNDVVFVVDIGEENVRELVSVPEPSATVALIGLAASSLFAVRRRRQNNAVS